MNTTAFLTLLHDETGLQYTESQLATPFDELEGWDSVFLMKLLVGIEDRTGRGVPMAELLDVTSLGELLDATTPATATSPGSAT